MSNYHFFKLACSFAFVIAITPAACKAADTGGDQATLIKQGEYLARASDCIACHTAPGGKRFAGGLPISSPVGVIYSTNITPSPSAGIGQYTEAQFAEAIRRGVRADGANLYAAMPYTSYSVFTDADLHALYTYFMQAVTPVDVGAPRTKLPFPLSIRATMMVWNALFLNGKPFQPDPHQSELWNRGKYLVTGAAHCSVCHTPRGFLMQEKTGLELSGAQVGPWFAPNVTSDVTSGIGKLSKDDLIQYLRTGAVHGKAQAAGSMGEAVEHSFQYLSASDVDAIATYVRTVPPIHDSADSVSRFDIGHASSQLSTSRGASGIQSANGNPGDAELFQGNCASCHSAQGQGSNDKYYPSLFDNSTVGALNTNNLIATIINGVNRTVNGKQAFMPGFGDRPDAVSHLTDGEIALLATYVRHQYGQGGVDVTVEQVAQVRQGGPSSSLVPMAQFGLAIPVGLATILLGFFLFKSQRRKSISTLEGL